jgi:coenzyme F420-reducing hydrogenase gamma subunit
MDKKLKVGWFSFTCCEDSTVLFVELMNDKFFEWKNLLEFKHFRTIKKNNTLEDIDVAFVEGAISSYEDEEKLKEIRKNSKKLVAVGSCAVTGMPSAQRNFFDEERKSEIAPIMEKFKHRDKVVPVKEIVQVDDEVPGCGMLEDRFLEVLNKYLKEFGVV